MNVNKLTSRYGLFILGVLLLSGAIFAAIALLSYHAHDQSFLYYSDIQPHVYNKMGILGAHFAAASFYLFGVSAYLLLPFLFYSSLIAFGVLSLSQEWDRLLAGGIGMVCSSVLLTMHGTMLIGTTLVSGGLVGYSAAQVALTFFEWPMVVLLLSFTLFASSLIVTRLAIVLVPYMAALAFADFVQRHKLLQKTVHAAKTFCVTLVMMMYSTAVWVVELASGSIASRYPELFSHDDDSTLIEDIAQESFWREHRTDESVGIFAKENAHASDIESTATDRYEEPVYNMNDMDEANSISVDREESKGAEYHLPDLSIFTAVKHADRDTETQNFIQERAKTLKEKLAHFGIQGEVTSIQYGPVITLFEYKPNVDIKVSKILALEDDLALALQAMSIRIIAPVPGKSVVGFEVANPDRRTVLFSEVIHSKQYQEFEGSLPLVLGADAIGKNVVVDLLDMPHLLVAGSTGSGKSVALNTMLTSLLCKKSPDELRMILIDPKRLEFSGFSDIAHLLFPIVIQPNVAVEVLKWVVKTMEDRYEVMSKKGVRNILEYHTRFGEEGKKEMPFIVLVIDELADLMMTTGKHIEDLIVRVAQMARAAGIHMIVATQRPSVDVITGLIKVNFPSRISFRVTSKVDSRTILDMGGAEKLLGRGDMLFMNSHSATPQRVHGAYVSNPEIETVIDHIRQERAPQYSKYDLEKSSETAEALFDGDDALYNEVLEFLSEVDEVSISLLQRRSRIGCNRSARIMEALEGQGHIISLEGGKMLKVVRQQEQETINN
ncbi:MAG TPA: DNA translocase FtsK [Candidatus Babeliales bacterium]|nr:DNA translocase FtsK [Candidatus Babeliales bacterium]